MRPLREGGFMRFLAKTIKRVVELALVVATVMVCGILATHFWMRLKFHALLQRGVPEGPNMEVPAERAMGDIVSSLREFPFKGKAGTIGAMAKGGLMNSFLLFLNAARATSGIMYPYPEEFEHVVIESFDGTPITCAVGIHKDGKPRPAIVMSHGFMGSKNDHYIIDLALTAYAEWGFNVLGIDLRNFGRSQSLAHGPTTAGWRESEDLLAAAKYMSERPEVTSVGITGFSMGAGSTMIAACKTREFPYLTGGAIAWNGYADAGFNEADFTTYIDKIAAPHHGVSTEEFFANASPKNFLADVEVPLLIVHALDDPICPASEMDELSEIAAGNPNVEIWMMPAGNHCLFRYLDKGWYDKVMRDFFTYWATW